MRSWLGGMRGQCGVVDWRGADARNTNAKLRAPITNWAWAQEEESLVGLVVRNTVTAHMYTWILTRGARQESAAEWYISHALAQQRR